MKSEDFKKNVKKAKFMLNNGKTYDEVSDRTGFTVEYVRDEIDAGKVDLSKPPSKPIKATKEKSDEAIADKKEENRIERKSYSVERILNLAEQKLELMISKNVSFKSDRLEDVGDETEQEVLNLIALAALKQFIDKVKDGDYDTISMALKSLLPHAFGTGYKTKVVEQKEDSITKDFKKNVDTLEAELQEMVVDNK